MSTCRLQTETSSCGVSCSNGNPWFEDGETTASRTNHLGCLKRLRFLWCFKSIFDWGLTLRPTIYLCYILHWIIEGRHGTGSQQLIDAGVSDSWIDLELLCSGQEDEHAASCMSRKMELVQLYYDSVRKGAKQFIFQKSTSWDIPNWIQ